MPSCKDCKFLWFKDQGYSNYTVEETEVRCALDRNPGLPARQPWDWNHDEPLIPDNWPVTINGCDRYESGPQVHMDVDGDNHNILDHTDDPEVYVAITRLNPDWEPQP